MKNNEKIYFEECGYSGGNYYKDHKARITLNIYIRPTGDGHAFKYNATGKLYKFAWANTKKARCYYVKDLPDELKLSFQYGTNIARVLNEKRDSWNLEDLEYEFVNLEEIAAYKKVLKEIKNVHTIEDFKKLYPTIKEGNRVDMQIMRKLFELTGTKESEIKNGEIGLGFLVNYSQFKTLLSKLNIEDESQQNLL